MRNHLLSSLDSPPSSSKPSRWTWIPLALVLLVSLGCPGSEEIPPRAIELRDQGFAELENEHPETAEVSYRSLLEIYPDDPLGHANLAIALLRQQKFEEAHVAIAEAKRLAPDDGSVLAIEGEILQWQGDLDAALVGMQRAMEASPNDLDILYAAYQLANTAEGDEAQAIAYESLRRLAELRPENVVVILQLGQQAIARGDRTTATGAYQRIAELLWQANPMAERAMGMVEDALRQDDVSAARVPAVRLENVLKISAMFRESLRELKTGIQGVPLSNFRGEAPTEAFGPSLDVQFLPSILSPQATEHGALAVGDFDGDQRVDIARLVAAGPADEPVVAEGAKTTPHLEIRLAAADFEVLEMPAETVDGMAPAPTTFQGLRANDLDNDGHLDLIAFGTEGSSVWRGMGDGHFSPTDGMGLTAERAADVQLIDFDIEGDLDVATAGPAGANLYLNNLAGDLQPVGEYALPDLGAAQLAGLAVGDLDRDGDLDIAAAANDGVHWLDNLRQGRFALRGDTLASEGLRGLVVADFSGDGYPDIVAAGSSLQAWRNSGAPLAAPRGTDVSFETWAPEGLQTSSPITDLLAFDGDNDGRLDIAAVGDAGLQVLLQTETGGFRAAPTAESTEAAISAGLQAVASADLDGDGDLDLVAAGAAGLVRFENQGGDANGWLAVRLRGLNQGNSKNNLFGVGSVVEVRNGNAYQYREASGDVVHLGLGQQSQADVLRVVWTNGVPQNRLQLAGQQQIVEEQLLKGSCPFLYAWNGTEYAFVTDLLWGAPLGLPVAPGAWASSDPSELVRIDGLHSDDGIYRLRITEELWEAAFFDHVRVWVVDHPADVEVASNLRIVPGAAPAPETVLASRNLRPLRAAWDGRGRDVTAEVAKRDEVYADGYRKSAYQGVAAEPWTFTMDLGAMDLGSEAAADEVAGTSIRLHLDGWIFPADASLNLAVAQRDDLPYLPPRLEMETEDGWQELMPSTGFPAGKTKTMVLDLPPLPPGVHKLRLVSSLWLHWDRIAWTTDRADDTPRIAAQLLPNHAELRFRGYSEEVRHAPNAPHTFDYQRTRTEDRWIPFVGHYTRLGDVLPLLQKPDDFSVILAPGDEIDLTFDGRQIAPLQQGWQRTLFLESHGWDKDADRNTYEAQQVEPLPFRAMSGYPYGADEGFPDSPEHQEYRREWLTRQVTAKR